MIRYLARKSFLYLLTFFVAVTIDWAIPRLMPGDPIDGLISRIQADSTASQELHGYFTKSFGLDQPLWEQYLNFWRGLLHGDLGPSIAYVGFIRQRADLGGAPLHPRPARPRDPAQLHRREPGRRDGRAAEGARQHRSARRVRAHRDAVRVARARARLLPGVPVGDLPRLRRVRLLPYSLRGRGSSHGASSPTGSFRS